MKKIEIKNLEKKFGARTLFSDVNLSFESHGFYALVGPSGGGKTTFLEILAGLDNRYSGNVLYAGKPITGLSEEALSRYRLRRIGYIRQGYDLLGLEKSLDNVLLPMKADSSDGSFKESRRGMDLLSSFGLKLKTYEKVSSLSGGEKQRVALSRALANATEVILADEPTGALDNKNSVMVYDYLKKLSEKMLVIMVSHDEEGAKLYADHLLSFENGTIVEKENEPSSSKGEKIMALGLRGKKKKPKVPLSFWFSHAIHLSLARKRRSFLSMGILTSSLLGLGLSVYLSLDVGKEINNALTSLVGGGNLLMKSRETGENSLSEVEVGDEDDLEKIKKADKRLYHNYGVSYLADFPSFFIDLDTVYIPNGGSKFVVDGLSGGSMNDFEWLDDGTERMVYPSLPLSLEQDEVVLGLPYATMSKLCLALQILRNYEDLGEYLRKKPLELVIELENEAWQYQDELLLRVVAVSESPKPSFFHLDHLWNEWVYETTLRFPSYTTSSPTPWALKKCYYLASSLSDDDFFLSVRKREELSSYIFEPPSSSYNRTVCEPDAECSLKRYYLYKAKKGAIKISDILKAKKAMGFSSFIVGGEASYVHFTSALMSGFASPFFASSSPSSLEMVVDSLTSLPLSQKDATPSLPSNVVEGTFTHPVSSSLTLSNDFSSLTAGRAPANTFEVCLSSSLAEKLSHPSELYVSGLVSEKESETRIERDYRYGTLKVVGEKKSSNDVLYVTSYFSIDFFRGLGMSSFLLEPTSVSFDIGSRESSALVASLSAKFPQYEFVDPSSSLASGTKNIISFVRLTLILACSSSVLLSLILLIVSSLLLCIENKKDGKMLFNIGIAREDIASSYEASLILSTGSGTILSALILSVLEYFIHKKIGEEFALGGLPFSFDPFPPLFIIVMGFAILLILLVGLDSWIRRRNFRLE